MEGILTEVGFADAVIVKETPDRLQLIDGHLHQVMLGKQIIPVLVLDVSEAEAAKLKAPSTRWPLWLAEMKSSLSRS